MSEIAYVALGSNLEFPEKQVQKAIEAIACFPQTTLIAASGLYTTPPWGFTEQPDFVNAVVKIATTLSPKGLLFTLFDLEQAQHRARSVMRNGPRTLDCDILWYGNVTSSDVMLTLPHPNMLERAFVLIPLAEIEPDIRLPQGMTIQEALAQCDGSGINKILVESGSAV